MEVLSRRALNRATLARQRLLHRGGDTALGMVERLVGLNAQDPDPPYVGLWSRIAGFEIDDLTGRLFDRSVVHGSLFRGTQHSDRSGRGHAAHPEPGAGGAVAGTRPGGAGPLGAVPAADPAPASDGTWGRGKTPFVLAESWLGRPLDGTHAAGELVLRYLAAFGPASVRDIAAWSGLTRLREVVDALRPQLRSFHDEAGRELVDLPDGPRPGPDVVAPVHFLAAAVTVDGFVRGVWRVRRADGTATVIVRLFTPLTGPEEDAVGRECMRLARFVAPDHDHDVRLVPLATPWPDSTPWDCSGMSAGRGRG